MVCRAHCYVETCKRWLEYKCIPTDAIDSLNAAKGYSLPNDFCFFLATTKKKLQRKKWLQLYEYVFKFCFSNTILCMICLPSRPYVWGHCACACVSSVCLPLTLLISSWALIRLALKAVGVWARKWRWDFGIKCGEGGSEIETNERCLLLSVSVKSLRFL